MIYKIALLSLFISFGCTALIYAAMWVGAEANRRISEAVRWPNDNEPSP